MLINKHSCITDDGGTPNRICYACQNEQNEKLKVPIRYYEKVFEINKQEAKSLNYFLLLHHGLLKEHPEHYEQLLRLINGLSNFIGDK